MHWAQRARLKRDWTLALRLATASVRRPVDGRRKITLISYRRRLITDVANLIGGAKLVIDAIRDAGLIVDDSDRWMVAEYKQALCGRDMPRTAIIIESMP
jgi:hypothetical protein